jgi:uncharacterized protein
MLNAPLTVPEQRVLGCLIEKRLTTPDQYPLSLNSLRLACNQSTNRNPVTDYDEATVREAAQRLCRHGLARLASGHASRAIKYRHLAEEGLGVGREEVSVLAVLLLRGPQTPGELKARSERMTRIESLAEVERVLDGLAERGYARRLSRRPGQKEDRFEHLLGEQGGDVASSEAGSPPQTMVASPAGGALGPREARVAAWGESADVNEPTRSGPSPDGSVAERLAALEAEVAALRSQLAALNEGPVKGLGPQ